MGKDKTVLEEIGISDKIVQRWKRQGLKITYPTRARTRFLKSDDGPIFVENADKFVPALSKEETKLYTKHPEEFRRDLLKNTRFYIRFCNFIFKFQKRTENLKGKEKTAALLSLLYLFQRAMDYHYYHWDRYLVYQNYPSTPVGHWWEKLKSLYTKATKEGVSKNRPPAGFLKLLAGDQKVFQKIRKNLSKRELLKLKQALTAIEVFEDAQQGEVEVVIDHKTKENTFFRTAVPMWDKFFEELKKNPRAVKKRALSKVAKILRLHPIIATRKFMLPRVLKYFDDEVFVEFEKEIKRWL